jgi:hypothetical protein
MIQNMHLHQNQNSNWENLWKSQAIYILNGAVKLFDKGILCMPSNHSATLLRMPATCALSFLPSLWDKDPSSKAVEATVTSVSTGTRLQHECCSIVEPGCHRQRQGQAGALLLQ